MTLRPTLPSLRGTRALRPRLRRRDDQVLELVGRRADRCRRSRARAPARSADRPATRRAPRCSSPTARRSARGCAAAAPDTTCSRSARRLPLRRGAARCRTPGTSSASPTARCVGGPQVRIGLTTFGMTSPAFSMSTRSPSRMSLRAMSSALCSVAIEIVEPARKTGSSTAYGVTAPVRPTLTSIFAATVVRLLRGELERRRPARKLRGRAEPFAQREVVHLDDDAVGVEVERPALLGPLVAEGDHLVDAVAARPVRFDRQPPCAHRRRACRRDAAPPSDCRRPASADSRAGR